MKMDTIPELPPTIKLYARQAFTLSCEQHGMTVPMSEVEARTLMDVHGLNLQLFWSSGSPALYHAEARFYPSSDGGQILLCFLRNKHGANVRLNPRQRDVFIGQEHGLPRLIASALTA